MSAHASQDGAGADGGATPRFAAYGATKRGLEQLSKSLRAELRMLGLKPTGARAMREYTRVVKALLRGEEVMYAAGGPGTPEHPVRFTGLEQQHVRLDPVPEVHVAGNGPLSLAVAGDTGDGLCVSVPRGGTFAEAMGHAGEDAADVIAAFVKGLGLPGKLSEVGVTSAQFEKIANHAMHDRWLHSNPRKITEPAQVMEILASAA